MINEIKNSGEKSKGLEKHLKDLKNYIDELYLYIDEGNKPYIDFSRYPFNVNGEDYFYVISHDNLVIDMDNFLQIVESIYEKLEGLSLLFLEISESSTINYYNE